MEEYGLRALLCLARLTESGQTEPDAVSANSMTIPEIAEFEGISVPYASKIMRKLRQGGLVEAARGRTGGYKLTLTPTKITLRQALEALGGPLMSADYCDRYPGALDECVHSSDCSLRGAFGGFTGYLKQILEMTTLADMTRKESDARDAVRRSAEFLIGGIEPTLPLDMER